MSERSDRTIRLSSDAPEDEHRSLADEAATWVPPWERAEPVADEPVADGSAVDEPADDESTVDVPEAVDSEAAAAAPAEPEPEVVQPEVVQPEVVEPEAEVAEPALGRTPEVAPVLALPPVLAAAELRGAVEAIMLVVDEPVSEIMLAQVLEQPTELVAQTLRTLSEEYTETGRGFELRRAAGGWRLYTRGDYASYVERFVLDGQQVRLTQASLETLALVAYKQPVTRSRISAIRGVNCDAVVRTLVSRGLIEECGSEPDSGAFLYRTTTLFLEKLGLDSVAELPPLAPFLPDEIDEIADAQQR